MDTTITSIDPAAVVAFSATAEHVMTNPPRKPKAALLRERRAALLARIQQIEQRENLKARKHEARRLILVGRCAEEWAARNTEFRTKLAAELNRFAIRPQDRAALGLPEKKS